LMARIGKDSPLVSLSASLSAYVYMWIRNESVHIRKAT
jgi:hypothetical protein